MARATKKKASVKSASNSDKSAKLSGKSNDLMDISIPGADTKKIPAKKQRT